MANWQNHADVFHCSVCNELIIAIGVRRRKTCAKCAAVAVQGAR